jgi:pimeloyl-ACP methyl ester carboxylesterase
VVGLLLGLLGVVGVTLSLHLLARLFRVPVASRLFGEMPWLPAEWCGPLAEGESVRFRARDGVGLQGTYLPTTAARRRGVIAFCHELNGDRWSALRYTSDLRRRGFDIFTFDFRNHGCSDRMPGYEPMPWVTINELHDVRGAIDYLCSRGDADTAGVGLMGISRGGTAAICAASQDARVRVLAVDGPVPTEQIQLCRSRGVVQHFLRPLRLLSMVPDVVLRTVATWVKLFVGWRCHCPLLNVDEAARQLQQPVLLIHARHDAHVPLEAVLSLRSLMPGRARLWVVPHARHTRAITTAPEEYRRRLARFFCRTLSTAPHVDAAHQGAPRANGSRASSPARSNKGVASQTIADERMSVARVVSTVSSGREAS